MWEGNKIYPIPVFTVPSKKIHGYVLRQEDLEECIQVSEFQGACLVLLGNIAETFGCFLVFCGLGLPKSKKEVSSDIT